MNELPLSFYQVLAHDKCAMLAYRKLTPVDKQSCLTRACKATSQDDLRLLVLSLEDKVTAVETH